MTNDFWETGGAAVIAHGVLNDFGVIGTAARTLAERWDVLPGPTRDQLLALINDSVMHGIARARFLALPSVLMAGGDGG